MNYKLVGISISLFLLGNNGLANEWDDRREEGRSHYRINQNLNTIIRKLNRLESRLRDLERSINQLSRQRYRPEREPDRRSSIYEREGQWKCIIRVQNYTYIGRATDRATARRNSLQECRSKGWNSCASYWYQCIRPY